MSPRSGDGAPFGGLRRLATITAVGALIVGAAAAAAELSSPSRAARTTSNESATAGTAGARATMTRASAPERAIVATATRRVPVYHRAHGRKAFTHFTTSNGYGQPRVFLVEQRRPGWEKVYLPMRPDGATGWIRDRDVSLAYDPYRVVVSLGNHRVKVYNRGRRIMSTKAGVGKSITATPKGTYFLVMLLKQPDPNGLYGPYAFGTSAFSNVFYSFGGGPGEIGLHGTDDPQGLGTSISHGCIRVSNTVIARLAKLLPLGTPVLIKD